ncbi:hypothetical protein HZC53_03135 [Candidatus Uhrbacteria bacterium]|nr:hypothetical protein [Candidatus Uhrbacteria bacterium]
MSDSVSSEFSSFLRLLAGDNHCAYIEDAKKLMKSVRSASEQDLSQGERKKRLDALSGLCRDLVRRLDEDRTMDYRFRIPISVREMSLMTLDLNVRLALLGNFEIAVWRFEHPEPYRRPKCSDAPPAV